MLIHNVTVHSSRTSVLKQNLKKQNNTDYDQETVKRVLTQEIFWSPFVMNVSPLAQSTPCSAAMSPANTSAQSCRHKHVTPRVHTCDDMYMYVHVPYSY